MLRFRIFILCIRLPGGRSWVFVYHGWETEGGVMPEGSNSVTCRGDAERCDESSWPRVGRERKLRMQTMSESG